MALPVLLLNPAQRDESTGVSNRAESNFTMFGQESWDNSCGMLNDATRAERTDVGLTERSALNQAVIEVGRGLASICARALLDLVFASVFVLGFKQGFWCHINFAPVIPPSDMVFVVECVILATTSAVGYSRSHQDQDRKNA
jgi:hypothetical protein